MKLGQLLQVTLLNAYSAFGYLDGDCNSSLSDFRASCGSIAQNLNVSNTIVYFSQFVAAGTNLSLPDNNVTCAQPSQVVPADICRIALYVATSNRSGISMEAWLPANWTGRFLSAGNGGVGGCIGYSEMAYASGYGFASVGANNGHNGTSGGAFLNNADIVADFAYRS
jgi:feruloyl esterase